MLLGFYFFSFETAGVWVSKWVGELFDFHMNVVVFKRKGSHIKKTIDAKKEK
jgi:hypothetical protein